MKMKIKLLVAAIIILVTTGIIFFSRTESPGITVMTEERTEKNSLFAHQCIDTMKVSRDRARELGGSDTSEQIIAEQVRTIADMGADCVAIATPYDEEFYPYLTQWVHAARAHNLSVWFRGNWSAWEGWFDYPTEMSPEEHIEQTIRFIRSNPDLFEDGDIFSANVEPENGAPFKSLPGHEKDLKMREYLVAEQAAVQRAFTEIQKDVTTDWISMSGGVAKTVLDKPTIDAHNGVVTLDHYVATVEDMREYIDYFHVPYQATIILGEFGAPIPDINGEMHAAEQAAFVDMLLWELFLQRKKIGGVNYWTLSESSTALLDHSGELKPVGTIIKKYYRPGRITVHTTDTHGKVLENTMILVQDDVIETTDENGDARFSMPEGSYRLSFVTPTGKRQDADLVIQSTTDHTVKVVF